MFCVRSNSRGVKCGFTVSRYFAPVELRVGTGSRGNDASNRNMAGAEGSSTYPGGKSEDLAGADVLNLRDVLFDMLWGIKVRKHMHVERVNDSHLTHNKTKGPRWQSW